MNVTLVCDHRILYGADGAEFLARVRELLEQPLTLALVALGAGGYRGSPHQPHPRAPGSGRGNPRP